jgi:hypothetical protein
MYILLVLTRRRKIEKNILSILLLLLLLLFMQNDVLYQVNEPPSNFHVGGTSAFQVIKISSALHSCVGAPLSLEANLREKAFSVIFTR